MRRILFTGASTLALLAAASAPAQNNKSAVTQTGDSAVANVEQLGSNNDSKVTQSMGGTVTVKQNGVTGSKSTVTTSADDRAPESTVKVTQSDDGSSSAATGQANVSTVEQVNVNGFGASGTGSTVDVKQNHNAAGAGQNSSYVRQGNNAVSGQVTVDQEGGQNSSNYTSNTSTDNDAVITQRGVGNQSDVQQDFQNGGARAEVNQTNDGGAPNSVFIDQISLGFSASPAQFAIGAEAYATQDGSNNSANISQTGFSDSALKSNFARVTQTGDDHVSDVNQSGHSNTAVNTQTGIDNDSSIIQSGNSNVALVGQGSSGNISDIMQSGNGNTATVSQNAAAPANPG